MQVSKALTSTSISSSMAKRSSTFQDGTTQELEHSQNYNTIIQMIISMESSINIIRITVNEHRNGVISCCTPRDTMKRSEHLEIAWCALVMMILTGFDNEIFLSVVLSVF